MVPMRPIKMSMARDRQMVFFAAADHPEGSDMRIDEKSVNKAIETVFEKTDRL